MTSFFRFFISKRKDKHHCRSDSVELRNVSVISHGSFKSISIDLNPELNSSQSSFPSEISKVESIEIVPGPDGRALRRGSNASSLHSALQASIEILDVDSEGVAGVGKIDEEDEEEEGEAKGGDDDEDHKSRVKKPQKYPNCQLFQNLQKNQNSGQFRSIQRPISSSNSSSEAELLKINRNFQNQLKPRSTVPCNLPPNLQQPNQIIQPQSPKPQISTKPAPSAIGVAFAQMLLQKFEHITNPEMRQEEQFTLILISRIYTTPQDVINGLSVALETQEPRVQKWVHDHKIVMDVQHVEKMGDMCRASRSVRPKRQRVNFRKRESLIPDLMVLDKDLTEIENTIGIPENVPQIETDRDRNSIQNPGIQVFREYSTLPAKKSPQNTPVDNYNSVRCVSLSTDARDSGVVVTSSDGSLSGRSDRSHSSVKFRQVNTTASTIDHDPWTEKCEHVVKQGVAQRLTCCNASNMLPALTGEVRPKIHGIGVSLNFTTISKTLSTESMLNMDISDVLKELDSLVTELNDFVCLSEKVKPVELNFDEDDDEVTMQIDKKTSRFTVETEKLNGSTENMCQRGTMTTNAECNKEAPNESTFRTIVCSNSDSSFGRRFIMELPTVKEEISSTDGSSSISNDNIRYDADGSQTSSDEIRAGICQNNNGSSPIRYLKQIEATLQVIELWSATSVPDFDNEKTLIAIEHVSDSIRLNLTDMERCDIITQNSAADYRTRAVRLVPSLLIKLNHERAYRARELEQQQLANSKTLHLSGLTKSIEVWKFSACYATNIYHLCQDFNQLAYHLTALELDKMSHVWPCELVECIKPKSSDLFDTGSTESKTSLNSYKEPPPSLEAYVSWFNRLSYFACSSVLLINPKSRHWSRKCADLLTYFINTAVACAEAGNFNSALAIALGLTLTPAGRLTKAWKKVDESKIKILRHIINPSQNFKNYRMIFKAVSSKSFDDDSVLVPFFSLFLKDMYFLGTMILQEDSSKVSCLGSGDWHESMRQLSIPIRTFKRCQLSRQEMFEGADSKVQDRILHELQNTLVLDDNSLMRLSFKLQKPETPLEKNQYLNMFDKKKNKKY